MSLRPVLYAIDQSTSPAAAASRASRPSCWSVRPRCGSSPCRCWRGLRGGRSSSATGATRWSLTGYCAGYLPWFADIDRQMYFFYAAPMAPFLVMMIALILGDMLYAPRQGPERRTLGLLVGVLLHRARHHELRLAVPDPDRAADLAVDVEHADLAAQLALRPLTRPLRAVPRPFPSPTFRGWTFP